MKADPRDWRKLPKFIIADRDSRNEGGENEPLQDSYVMHCHEPRFLMRFVFGPEDDLYLIDSTADDETLIPLMHKAREFFFQMHPTLRA